MSDTMKVQSFETLLRWALAEYEQKQSIFGLHRSLFYTPTGPYGSKLYGQHLASPVGPAAGPHTQLAQNIVCAWLSGGRFIELKTVQIMDELEIPRPCIDMEDEGYNVEWSQELKLEQSAREYINAWALIHILHRLLGFEKQSPCGTIFNMSVGYNLEGIQSQAITRFMQRMRDASENLAPIRAVLQARFPQFADIEIPTQLTNNVTLSTMHGCPPDEIERIARYLLEEQGLHTTVKLNPTLLGKDQVLSILHDSLGFETIHIPDSVFEHDLRYERALALIRSLKQVAAARGLSFGVKLSNTLAMANRKGALPGEEMYMSGRALYPITMNLFYKLAHSFNGDLNVSYSAGADALNLTGILAAGARPVTVASDLLKPGGYSRLTQYLENLEADMRQRGVASLDTLAQDKLANLERAAAQALQDIRYKKSYFPHGLPKVETGLELFDCIVAPCRAACAVCQDVPEYAWWIAQGDYDRALQVIMARNPLPGVTGYACTQLCQTRCTRNDYEEAVAIRALKRSAAEKGRVEITATTAGQSRIARQSKVAVIGAGPSGLSAAYFLALNGAQVVVFEAKDVVGGMLRLLPAFRLPLEIIQQDVDRIVNLGVEIKCSTPITRPPETLLKDGFAAVYIASGFQKDLPLRIPGDEGQGVFAALDLLERARRGEKLDLGRKALVIGGGDTAMDAARVAQRLTGQPATVVYRRSRREMPASHEEQAGAFEEGALLEELATPTGVILKDGRVTGLECVRNRLGDPDSDGRRRPIPIEGSAFQIEADSVIVAIGQAPDLLFLNGSAVSLSKNGAIAVEATSGRAGPASIYAGGDVVDGPESIIAACADGRRAAEAICNELGLGFETLPAPSIALSEEDILRVKRMRARKELQRRPAVLPPTQRRGFELIEASLDAAAAQAEALRCVQCTTLCDKCVEVCPNRANFTYTVSPLSLELPRLACQAGQLVITGQETFKIEQTRQILHLDDFCNECGNCATFCVHRGQPYTEKPRLFLQEGDFELEQDNAFYILGNTIRRRAGGQTVSLTKAENGEFVFGSASVHLRLSPGFEIRAMTLKQAFEGDFSLRPAAEMAVLWEGVAASLTFLVEESH